MFFDFRRHMIHKIKILFLASDPADISRIRLGQEVRQIEEKIQLALYRDRFELIPQFAVRIDDVQQALLRYRPHIVHFSGHGSETSGIILENNSGMSKAMSKEALANLFSILKNNIRVVVMNACYSRVQADSISQEIDYTVGMNTTIGDQTAIIFSSSFYRALGFGETVRSAFELARNSIMSEGIPEKDVPELLVRRGVNENVPFLISDHAEEKDRSPETEKDDALPIGGNSIITNVKDSVIRTEQGDVLIGHDNRK
jgi:hypothetical protein